MTAAACTAEPTQRPDPRQDRPAVPISGAPAYRAPAPTRIARLLGALHSLIAFGRELAATLQRDPLAAETRVDVTVRFGTIKIALILARITRGLRLAEALEAKLAPRADRPVRPYTERAPRASSSRKPRGPRGTAPQPTTEDLDTLPTAEEIAEQLRTRPVHAVLLEICSNLGIQPADPFWQDITRIVTENGGSFIKLWRESRDRARLTNFFPPDAPFILPKPQPVPALQLVSAATASTGPP